MKRKKKGKEREGKGENTDLWEQRKLRVRRSHFQSEKLQPMVLLWKRVRVRVGPFL